MKAEAKPKGVVCPKHGKAVQLARHVGDCDLELGIGLKPRTGDSCPVSNLSVQVAMHDYWNICWKKDDGLRTLKPKIGVLSQRKGWFIVAKHFLPWRECTQRMIPNPLIHALGVSWRQPGHPSTTLPATGAGSRWANRNGGHQDAHPRWPVANKNVSGWKVVIEKTATYIYIYILYSMHTYIQYIQIYAYIIHTYIYMFIYIHTYIHMFKIVKVHIMWKASTTYWDAQQSITNYGADNQEKLMHSTELDASQETCLALWWRKYAG